MAWPDNLTLVYLRGQFLTGTGSPVTGTINLTPSVNTLVDDAANIIVKQSQQLVTLDATGSFSVALVATDDPVLNPSGWTYRVNEPGTGRVPYYISVPVSTPVLSSMGDPLNGQRVLELADVAPASNPSNGVWLLRAGISSIANDGSGGLTFTMTDGTTQDVPGPFSGGGGIVDSVTATDATIVVSGTGTNPTVGVGAIPESKVTGLVSDLVAKAVDSAVVHNTGAENVAGVKTFSSAPVVPASSFPESAVTNLTTDLAGKASQAYATSRAVALAIVLGG